jgi:DNA-binding NarL/FixJ family response regulator
MSRGPSVLLIDTHRRFPVSLPETLQERPAGLRLEICPLVSQALAWISQTSYDAVITAAETADELAIVVRIRKLRSDVPILLVTSEVAGPMADTAAQVGVDLVLPRKAIYEEMVESIELAVELAARARQNHRGVLRAKALAGELARLAEELHAQTREALSRTNHPILCVPLLVDSDAVVARGLRLAFRELDPFIPFHSVRSAEAAREYLERRRQPDPITPSIVLVAPTLGSESGFELLRWIRSHPRLHPLRVLVLASTPAQEEQARTMGAESSPKPATLEERVRLARQVVRSAPTAAP